MKHSSSATSATTAATAAFVASSALAYYSLYSAAHLRNASKESRRAHYASLLLAPKEQEEAAARRIQGAWEQYKLKKCSSSTCVSTCQLKQQQAAISIQRAWKKESARKVMDLPTAKEETEEMNHVALEDEATLLIHERVWKSRLDHDHHHHHHDATTCPDLLPVLEITLSQDDRIPVEDEEEDGSVDTEKTTSMTKMSMTRDDCDNLKDSKAAATRRRNTMLLVRFIMLLVWCSSVWWIGSLFQINANSSITTTTFIETSSLWSRRHSNDGDVTVIPTTTSITSKMVTENDSKGGLLHRQHTVLFSDTTFLQDFYPME